MPNRIRDPRHAPSLDRREREERRATPPLARPRGGSLPRGVSLTTPVELCINRELLVTLLSASIEAMHRHQRERPHLMTTHARQGLETVLGQHLAFRTWARARPARYISIAALPHHHGGDRGGDRRPAGSGRVLAPS